MGRWNAAALAAGIALLPASAAAQSCPQPLAGARRLVIVSAEGMTTSAARLRLFERASAAAPWRPHGAWTPARIGRAGMAWGYPFRGVARAGGPVKVEGDKRTPAGLYRVGRAFGFAASRLPGYLRVTTQTVCVDDVRSPAYNTFTTRTALGRGVHVERMWADRRYRRGLWVDYPTHAAARAGSCIFIHVWKSPTTPTTGCIAVSERRMAELQAFAAPGAVLAVVPEQARERWPGCLPR